MSAIEFRNFSCLYKLKRKKEYFTAVDLISFSIEYGEFVVIVGESGSGKTTLLKACLGFADFYKGDLFINGKSIEDIKLKEINCSYVSQEITVYSHLNVFENIAFPLRQQNAPYAEVNTRVKDIASQVGLEMFLTRKPHQLSIGQQQRMSLARSMIKNPSFVFLDEPFANIDALLRVNLRLLLKELHTKFNPTILFVTHDISEAFALADKIVVLENGKLVEMGTPKELKANHKSELLTTYFGK